MCCADAVCRQVKAEGVSESKKCAVCVANVLALPPSLPEDCLHGGAKKEQKKDSTHSFEFSNCARTAMIAEFLSCILVLSGRFGEKGRVGEKLLVKVARVEVCVSGGCVVAARSRCCKKVL